jgi:cystathionine beta-lyase/cystathionine gamma-synthase
VPIHLSSTFSRKEVDKPTNGYEYSRSGNPTRNALERRLAALEDAKFGLAFASGLAAETVIALTLLKSGDHVVAFDDLYGGTRRLFNKVFNQNFKVEFSYVDARSINNVEKAINDKTKLIWLETPTNPLMKLCDIKQISKIKKVNFPGLKKHPQYELAKQQMSGFGGMLSFEIKGNLKEAKQFLETLKIISLAESLGGVESLIENPALMTHSSIPKTEREKIGITHALIRLSVGIENVEDLMNDLNDALTKKIYT